MKAIIVFTTILLLVQVLLSISGFSPGQTLINGVFDIINHPENITFTSLFSGFGGILAAILAGSAIAGFYFSSISQGLLLGGVATLFMTFVADFATTIRYLLGKDPTNLIPNSSAFGAFGLLIAIIYGILMVAYLIVIIDWWRGLD